MPTTVDFGRAIELRLCQHTLATICWHWRSSMNQLVQETEVLIVGAGPSALTLAAALRQRGVEVVVIDRAAEMAGTSRAAVFQARALEGLGAAGVTKELVSRGSIVPRFSVRDGDRALITIDFDGLPTDHP